MQISTQLRQDIIDKAGRAHVAFQDACGTLPNIKIYKAVKLPEDFLPFSKNLIIQAISEELRDPAYGANLRKKEVKQWINDLQAFWVVIETNYLPREVWVTEMKKMDKLDETSEKKFLQDKLTNNDNLE